MQTTPETRLTRYLGLSPAPAPSGRRVDWLLLCAVAASTLVAAAGLTVTVQAGMGIVAWLAGP